MSETTGMNPVTAFGISDDHEALRPNNDGISDEELVISDDHDFIISDETQIL